MSDACEYIVWWIYNLPGQVHGKYESTRRFHEGKGKFIVCDIGRFGITKRLFQGFFSRCFLLAEIFNRKSQNRRLFFTSLCGASICYETRELVDITVESIAALSLGFITSIGLTGVFTFLIVELRFLNIFKTNCRCFGHF